LAFLSVLFNWAEKYGLWPRSCSRRTWGRRAAYASQFLDADNRAHRGKAKIKARLIADLDPDEWGLPPKPNWMRWSTYNWLVDRFDRYEEILDRGIAELMAKLRKNKTKRDQYLDASCTKDFDSH
jgi:hypothetical protein